MCAFTTTNSVKVISSNSTLKRLAGDRNCRVVLLATINPVRKLVIGRDTIKLRGGLINNAGPRFTAIECHRGATVVAIDNVAVIRRIDPEVVMIPVRPVNFFPALAAIH